MTFTVKDQREADRLAISALRAIPGRVGQLFAEADAVVPDHATRLAVMTDPAWLRSTSTLVGAEMRAPRGVIADALLSYGLVSPLIVGPVTSLARTGAALPVDIHRTFVTLSRNGSLDAMWLATRPCEDEPDDDPVAVTARHLRELLEPMAIAATSVLRIGRRQYWRLAADRIVRVAWEAAESPSAGLDLAVRVLTAAGSPIVFVPSVESVVTSRGAVSRPRSRSCCLGYQIPDLPYCAGCPREREPMRTQRLTDYLSR